MDEQQTQHIPVQESVQYIPLSHHLFCLVKQLNRTLRYHHLPPLGQIVPQPTPFILQSQTEIAPPPTMVVVSTSEDAHAHMDKLEQKMRQLRVSDGGMVWDDFDGLPLASLLAKFRMPEIERYTGI